MNLSDRSNASAVHLLRRLDYLPTWLAVGLGVGAGVFLGMALASASLASAVVGFVLALGCAVALAFSGEAVAVLEEVEKKETFTGPELVDIPAGRFLMGSPDDEKDRLDREGPVHEVYVAAFQCMRFLVTRRLYKEVMGEDPGWPEQEADERPVNQVSWRDAVQFCNRLSEWVELKPCYRIDEDSVSWDVAADGYRLLSEAEWEYACRAGTRTRWFFGDDEQELGQYAWFDDNSDEQPCPVGQKKPNAWGLYDMYGNVFEWCWDWFGAYSAASQTNPTGDRHLVRSG